MNITDPPMSTTARWFVCQTKGLQETIALENLQRQKFEAYLPMHLVVETGPRLPGGRRVVPKPFFPRYIFVKVDMSVAGWRSLYGTRGITGVLPGTDRSSRLLLEPLIEEMRQRELQELIEAGPDLVACPWKPGDRVEYGPFRDAIFRQRVDAKRGLILVTLLGRETLQEVDLSQLS
ncbi:MAG: transcription termination/antitermination protein NusG [Pseudomonadota bacterium]